MMRLNWIIIFFALISFGCAGAPVKKTTAPQSVQEETTAEPEEEEEGGLPGFGAFASLLALTIIVLTRRRD